MYVCMYIILTPQKVASFFESVTSRFRFSISPVQVRELTLYTLLRPTPYIVIPVLGLSLWIPRMGLEKEKLFASGCSNNYRKK